MFNAVPTYTALPGSSSSEEDPAEDPVEDPADFVAESTLDQIQCQFWDWQKHWKKQFYLLNVFVCFLKECYVGYFYIYITNPVLHLSWGQYVIMTAINPRLICYFLYIYFSNILGFLLSVTVIFKKYTICTCWSNWWQHCCFLFFWDCQIHCQSHFFSDIRWNIGAFLKWKMTINLILYFTCLKFKWNSFVRKSSSYLHVSTPISK